MHDDAPRLMFRSLTSFYRAAIATLKSEGLHDFQDVPGDFTGPQRTKQDATTAERLIALAKIDKLTTDQQSDALRFACDLLADKQVRRIKSLVKLGSAEVESHINTRLEEIAKSAKPANKTTAKVTAGGVESNFDAFVTHCHQQLQSHGFKALCLEMYGRKTIRLDPGPIWLNMDFFYNARRRPDFEALLIEQVTALTAPKGKTAKHRKK